MVLGCDPQFISQVWCNFYNTLGASSSLTSGYHPQSSSQAEQCNQELETTIQRIAKSNPSAWSQHLTRVDHVHNAYKSLTRVMSPFEASLGYEPPLFSSQETNIAIPSVQYHFRQCWQVWRQAKAALICAKTQNKRFTDRHSSAVLTDQVGQKVWLSTRDINIKDTPRKMVASSSDTSPSWESSTPQSSNSNFPRPW